MFCPRARRSTRAAVTSLVSQAANVTLLKPLGKQAKPEYGLDKPQAIVTKSSASSRAIEPITTLTLRSAPKTRLITAIVKSSASEYIVKVSEYSVRDFVTKNHARLRPAADAHPPRQTRPQQLRPLQP